MKADVLMGMREEGQREKEEGQDQGLEYGKK